ncbi:MAG: hypothetical protein FWG12_07870 [Holophagaceae bacterium]|nr:hypothetical protein [Holophagaceae bacterium]
MTVISPEASRTVSYLTTPRPSCRDSGTGTGLSELLVNVIFKHNSPLAGALSGTDTSRTKPVYDSSISTGTMKAVEKEPRSFNQGRV